MTKTRLSWRAPRWSYAPRVWRGFRDTFLNWQVVLSFLVFTAVWLWLRRLWRPQPQRAFAEDLLFDLLLVYGVHAWLLVWRMFVKSPKLTLRTDEVQFNHDVDLTIKPGELRRAWLYVHAPDRIRLKLRYRGRKTEQTLSVGVPATVDLERLAALLPIELLVRDARGRARPAAAPQPRVSRT